MIQLTDRELGAVLAGLHMYQEAQSVNFICNPETEEYTLFCEVEGIATDGGSFRALSWPEVEDLCERLNEPCCK